MTEDEKSDQAYAEASERGAQLIEKLISMGLIPADKSAKIEAEYYCRIAFMHEHKQGYWRGAGYE